MYEIRKAQKGEITSQKEIWQLCFGDRERYIDFYYANRYQEEETLLLLHDGNIASMLTLIPVQTVIPDNTSFESVMLYAYATHPKYQKRGFATRIMEFTNQYLAEGQKDFSILVPQAKDLFDFYRDRGYRECFSVKEAELTAEDIDRYDLGITRSCTITSASPETYNQRRRDRLRGRFHIAYHDADILYQKKLSQLSGADIYHVDFEGIQGCAVVERMNPDKILVKEILLPDEYIFSFMKQLRKELAAKQYYLRMPVLGNEKINGTIRPFGMIRAHRAGSAAVQYEDSGYMGLAFD
jgi:GNAT superfamily N-acetyltransferase